MRRAFAVSVVGSLALVTAGALAQTRSLIPGGSRSHYGTVVLAGEFEPDPHEVQVRSGGNLDVASMDLGPECLGFAMDRPDVILRYSEPGAHLSFYGRATTGDVTLIVHTPDGRWLCDDDGAGGTNPRLDIESPRAGQYDIWVGSLRAEQNVPTRLDISRGR